MASKETAGKHDTPVHLAKTEALPAPSVTAVPPTLPGIPSAELLPPAMPGAMPSPPTIPTVTGHGFVGGADGGRYQLGTEIARGGMGRVVEATDGVLGRVVAYKEVLARDADTLQRFARETRITARLEHPSIVPVHDAGESPDGAPFYVMRKVSGRPLERLVANAGTLGQRLALIPHIVDSAQAIAHAHERGIVHRDIKPSNILIGELGETVVIDWGLAKVIGEADDPVHGAVHGKPLVDLDDTLKTRAGIVYGTPGFMAPEQLRGEPVTEQCDVYALGATLYHLLSRKPPHYAQTADAMMKAAVAAPPTPIREMVDGVPPELATIVDKALAHEPEHRYPDARSLALDLQQFLAGQLVASHHYSRREKLVRFVRKNRGLSAAVAALVVVGSLGVARIIVERNRADRAALHAREQAAEAERKTEQLTLAQARHSVDVNPTKAVAMIKPLAVKHWREVRAIAVAARAMGVAWSAPVSLETRSLELSSDGLRALSAGADGVVRLHDLVNRSTQVIAELNAPALARFAGGELAVAHDRTIRVLAPSGAQRHAWTAPSPVADLAIAAGTAYWIDGDGAVWRAQLAGGEPVRVELIERAHAIVPSPDGRWVALACEHQLLLHERERPDEPVREVMFGNTVDIAWSGNSEHLAAVVNETVVDVETVARPRLVHRQNAGRRQFVAHDGVQLFVVGPTGVATTSRHDRMGEQRTQLSGRAVGLAEARGRTVIAGATGGLTVMSPDGDRVLPLQGAHVLGVAASPKSPYVLALVAGRLLVWNLDEIQPRRISDQPASGARFAGRDRVIAGGMLEHPARAIDVATGAVELLGAWQGMRTMVASSDGRTLAIIDDAHQLHVVRPGDKPDLPPSAVDPSAGSADRPASADPPESAAAPTPDDPANALDFAGFATNDQVVLVTEEGTVDVYDVTKRSRTTLLTPPSPLLGLAWGRGKHPWVAAALADGTLWRRNMATGATSTITRRPSASARPIARDSKLLVRSDGTVLYLHGSDIYAWGDDRIDRLVSAPKSLSDFGEAGAREIIGFADDATIYVIDLESRASREALPSVVATSGSMSPETGRLVVIEHGALHILDPLVRQRWMLAPAGVAYQNPSISADGSRIVVQAPSGLLLWSIDLPATPENTARWLDAMTNAVDDASPGGLGWH